MVNYTHYSSILFGKWNDSPISGLNDSFKSNKAEITCRVSQIAIFTFSVIRIAQIVPVLKTYRWEYMALNVLVSALSLLKLRDMQENRVHHQRLLAIMTLKAASLTTCRSVSGVASLISFLVIPICLHKWHLNQFHSNIFNFRDSQQNTILHLAVKENELGCAKEIVNIIQTQYQKDYTTYLSSFNKEGYTALHLAKSPEMIKFLVDHQANPNEEANNDKGYTPLMLAAQNNSLDLIDALIEAKADPEKSNKKKETAYDVAIQNNHEDAAKKIGKKKEPDQEKAPELDKTIHLEEAAKKIGEKKDPEPEAKSQQLEKAIHNLDREKLQSLLDSGVEVEFEHLKKAIAGNELDIFHMLLKAYDLKMQEYINQNLPGALAKKHSELGNLFQFISYKNLFSLLKTSRFSFLNTVSVNVKKNGSASNYLLMIAKEKLLCSQEELKKLYQYEQKPDSSWVCKVEVKGEILGEGKDTVKESAQDIAANLALRAMMDHEKYFKHLLLTIPSGDTNPTSSLLTFFQTYYPVSGDELQGMYRALHHVDTGKVIKVQAFCLLRFDDMPLGLGEGEEEKPVKKEEEQAKEEPVKKKEKQANLESLAKEKAREMASRNTLLVLKKKMESITLKDINNLT